MDIRYNYGTMNTATIFIKTEPKVKEEAQKTADKLGFSLSSILNAFLRQFVKTKTIHFSVADEKPNQYLSGLLKKAEADLKKGETSPKFKTAEEFVEYLHKQAA
jgi:addiction module RelB/DinJ family antitoxin